MAETLGAIIGPLGFYAYSIGFWAAVFASLLGVWQSLPYLFADYYGLMRRYSRHERERLTSVTSTPYRVALLFVTLVPIPFAFIDQPLIIIRTFTIVGSLFIPFLAATLIYLNNFKIPAGQRRAEELGADQRRARLRAGAVRRRRRIGGRALSLTSRVVTRC